MRCYLVSAYWRGALNIGHMRAFDNEIDAWAYYENFDDGFRRIYEISNINAPVLLKEKDRPEKL